MKLITNNVTMWKKMWFYYTTPVIKIHIVTTKLCFLVRTDRNQQLDEETAPNNIDACKLVGLMRARGFTNVNQTVKRHEGGISLKYNCIIWPH